MRDGGQFNLALGDCDLNPVPGQPHHKGSSHRTDNILSGIDRKRPLPVGGHFEIGLAPHQPQISSPCCVADLDLAVGVQLYAGAILEVYRPLAPDRRIIDLGARQEL